MATWFVSRHPGAQAWARERGIVTDYQVDHLALEQVSAGDRVLGTLPIHLAAGVCARGARYIHLTLHIPRELRGQELSAEALNELGASLQEFHVEARPCVS